MFSPVDPQFLTDVIQGPALHIPDGFLSVTISVLFWFISVGLIVLATRKTRGELGERQIPLMGIMAAFIFAGQMINFPVAGGTSGHFLGGALAAMVLGPWAGMLVMTAVIGLQALLFQDGGLLVMGANIFNMGLVTALIGYGFYRAAAGRGRRTQLGVAGVAAWLSVMAGAFFTALQLWLSGTSPLAVVMPAMLVVHALIGLGEALITVAALAFIARVRPDLLGREAVQNRGGWGWVAGGLSIALVVVLLAPLASTNPDGLVRVATDLGFISAEAGAPVELLPGYTIPGLGSGGLSTILAGLAGVAAVSLLAVGLGRWLKRPDSAPLPAPEPPASGRH